MIIETKYKIGDVVWFQTLGINYNAKITHISVDLYDDGKNIISYNLRYQGFNYERYENELFSTKEELLNSLQ